MDASEATEMFDSIMRGDISIAKQTLNSKTGYLRNLPNVLNGMLTIAAHSGHTEIIRLGLDLGADVNAPIDTMDNKTLLMIATEECQKSCVEVLLDLGAVITEGNNSLHRLHVAAVAGDKNLLDKCIAQGLDVKQKSEALYYAAKSGNREIVDVLLQNGARIDLAGDQILHSAVLGGNIEIVKIFLNLGCDIYERDEDGSTTLHYAAKGGYPEMVEFILNQGVNISVKNVFGRNALSSAAISSRPIENVVKMLLNSGLDINDTDQMGNTTLNFVARSFQCHSDTIETLLKLGANIDTINYEGNTPLLSMCFNFLNRKNIFLLLKYGANVNVKNKKGMTALLAVFTSRLNDNVAVTNSLKTTTKVVEELIKHGADVKAEDNNGRTALSYALEYGSKCRFGITDNFFGFLKGPKEIVELLLHHGGKINGIEDQIFNYFQDLLFCPACIEPFLNSGYKIRGNYKIQPSFVYSSETFGVALILMNKIIIRRMVKMKHQQNLDVPENDLKGIQKNAQFNVFMNKCEEEVNEMKEKLGIYNLFTSKDLKKLAKLASQEEVVQVFASNQHKTMFPIYADYLSQQFENGAKAPSLLREVKGFFQTIANSEGNHYLPKLPDLCVDLIYEYLNLQDLETLAYVCNPRRRQIDF